MPQPFRPQIIYPMLEVKFNLTLAALPGASRGSPGPPHVDQNWRVAHRIEDKEHGHRRTDLLLRTLL